MSQALYRKWRPARFNDVVGQEHITRTLQNSVVGDRIGHAYLFCGPRGTGKTTSARLLAKAVNCLHQDRSQRPCNTCALCVAVNEGRFLDLIEIDAASNTGVDDIRDLRDKINFSPSQGRMKVYIIDEVHMLSMAAFNALLKTLEEPPPHAMFVLATTEEHKVPLTIKSRCQQFNFRLLTVAEIIDRLAWLARQELLQIEPEALDMIARQGAGSLRDAESLLDQLVVTPGDTITLERAQMVLGIASNTTVVALTDAWLNGNGADGLRIIHQALASGTDARQFCRQMVAYLRHLLLLQAAGDTLMLDVPVERKEEMLAQVRLAPRAALIEAVKLFNEAAMTPASSWQPQLPLELAFVELLPDQPLTPTRSVVAHPVAPPAVQAIIQPTAVPPAMKAAATPLVRVDEEPEVVEATAVALPSAISALSLQQITSLWREMMTRAGQFNKNLPPLLNMSKPLAIEQTQIMLGFDYPIFKSKFDDMPGAAHAVGELFSELLQTNCTVRSVITSQYKVPISKDAFQALADELGGVVREE